MLSYQNRQTPERRTVVLKGTYLFSDGNATILAVCQLIKAGLSSASQLFYPTDVGYEETIKHFLESSSTRSFCSVEPGTAADVAIIVSVVVIPDISLQSDDI